MPSFLSLNLCPWPLPPGKYPPPLPCSAPACLPPFPSPLVIWTAHRAHNASELLDSWALKFSGCLESSLHGSFRGKGEQRNPGKKLSHKGTARRQAPEGSGQATGTPQETQPPAREGAGGTFRELGQDLPHSQPETDGEEKPERPPRLKNVSRGPSGTSEPLWDQAEWDPWPCLSLSCHNHSQPPQLPPESTAHTARVCCGKFPTGALRKPWAFPETSGGYGWSCHLFRQGNNPEVGAGGTTCFS